MTQTTGGPRPGWYPAPNEPGQMRWFDGTGWTEQRTPDHSAYKTPGPMGPGYARLALALQILLGVSALLSVSDIGIAAWTRSVLGRWLSDPDSIDLDEATRIDTLTGWSGRLDLVVYLVCGVLFIVWLHKAYVSPTLFSARFRHKPGWTIGSWFVPFLNLWRPYQLVDDLAGAAAARIPTERTLSGILPAWWAAFLVMNFADQASLRLSRSTDAMTGIDLIKGMRMVAVADVMSGLVGIVAAAFAIIVVRRITALLTREREVVSPVGR